MTFIQVNANYSNIKPVSFFLVYLLQQFLLTSPTNTDLNKT